MEKLIKDAKTNKYIENMQNAVDILGEYLLPFSFTVSFVQKRFLNVFCSYAFRYALYIQEISKSINTLNFLSINAIGRSAIECYALAKFIYLHQDSNLNKLFQCISFSDIKENFSIYKNYDLDSKNNIKLESQKTTTKQIFESVIKDYFIEAELWFSQNLRNEEIIKNIKKILKQNNFAPDVCKDGCILMQKLVSKILVENKFYNNIFGHTVEANTFYSLMCSSAHNNYNDVMQLFRIENTDEFKVSLYPQPNERNNAECILKLLYANLIDIVNCLKEITAKIRCLNNKQEWQE